MSDERVARALAFAALATFAGAHWAGMVAPGALMSVVGAVALSVGVAFAPRPRRVPPIGLVALALAGVLVATLVLAGVPVRLLDPRSWGELASGIGSGLEALPGTRVPYGGDDAWVRATIVAGGVLLVGVGGLLALGRRPHPLAAAAVLGVLYAVPVVERDPPLMYLDGALFAVLCGAMVWGGRLRGTELRIAGGLLAACAAVGLAVAPRVDASEPWLDYEQLARDLDEGRSARFDWNHGYGPLRWARDGREVLRVRSRREAYWKATSLEDFDGVAWHRGSQVGRGVPDTEVLADRWRLGFRVTVRGLRTRDVVGAGTTTRVVGRPAVEGPPGSFQTIGRELRRGDRYDAQAYVPRPSVEAMRAAGTDYPWWVRRQLRVRVPPPAPASPGLTPGTADGPEVQVAAWGHDEPYLTTRGVAYRSGDGREVLEGSDLARMFALARRQRQASSTPYDFARRVEAFLKRGATYTESPRPSRLPLDTFVFDRREGYCQQFSGAMALLLRLGGVPARVASGFSPGTLDEGTGEWVVRDLDAHSWVEVYFPRIGWVTFDPTPSGAPAEGRPEEELETAAEPGDERALDDPAASGAAPADGGGGGNGGGEERETWPLVAALVALFVAGGGGAVAARRRRRAVAASGLPAEVAELLGALRATGRPAAPGLTLHAVERSLAGGAPEARAYVRALRERRFAADGETGAPPDPLGRAALRRELAEGLDRGARIAAFTALPPTRAELRARLRAALRHG